MSDNFDKKLISATKKYVAVVDGGGPLPRCVEFTLPDNEENTLQNAKWFYLNRIDQVGFLYFVISQEVYYNNNKFDISELKNLIT